MNKKTEVLIVGAGPVGLTMGIELARYGVQVRIIDQSAEPSDKSKALVVWSRPLELLERAGVSADLIEAGYKVSAVKISAGTKNIASLAFDTLEARTKYPYALMIPQNETERVLGQHLKALGVTVERSATLMGFVDSGDKVVSTIRHSDGKEESVESGWIIGSDGAHSLVRHQLGMEFLGETSPINWILADIHLENRPRTPEIDIVWHADGVLALFPISENRYRIIADAGNAAENSGHPSEPTLADVQAILDTRFGGVRATEPIWISSFRINERKVKDYSAGRAFLAGDAAHVHSPAGGQGMNTGMQDAINLAWKLALVVHGTAPASLLESYSAERSPVAEQVLKVTGRATTMSTLTGEVAQFFRNHTAALVLGLSPVRKLAAGLVSEISVGYGDSPLNAGGHHGHPSPGERAPIRSDETPVGAGNVPRFALFADPAGMPADLLPHYAGILEPALRKPFDATGLWLVRPDGYVALSTKAGDWDAVSTYLNRQLMAKV
jgi:2-polyprenyl-6-methoxyphenol hydroxylase-like FAD-dependent oxidoreductase